MPRRDVQRKPPGINLRRRQALVAHQALQRLQRDPHVKHVHGVAVPESVRRHRYRKSHAVIRCGSHGFVEPGPYGTVDNRLQAHLFRPSDVRIAPLNRDPQRGHHHLQLGDVLRIGQRDQAVRNHAGGRATGAAGGLFAPLLERRQLHKRVGRRQGEVGPSRRRWKHTVFPALSR